MSAPEDPQPTVPDPDEDAAPESSGSDPNSEPFAGDDDIRSGHYSLGADEQA